MYVTRNLEGDLAYKPGPGCEALGKKIVLIFMLYPLQPLFLIKQLSEIRKVNFSYSEPSKTRTYMLSSPFPAKYQCA